MLVVHGIVVCLKVCQVALRFVSVLVYWLYLDFCGQGISNVGQLLYVRDKIQLKLSDDRRFQHYYYRPFLCGDKYQLVRIYRKPRHTLFQQLVHEYGVRERVLLGQRLEVIRWKDLVSALLNANAFQRLA